MPDIVTAEDKLAQKRLEKLIYELPPYVKTFINAKTASKSIRTLLGYAQDLRTFFYYIIKNNPSYAGSAPSAVKFEDLADLDVHDIEEYVAFIKYYEVDDVFDRAGNKKARHNGDDAIRRKVATLSTFYSYFYKINEIPGNPVQKFELPRRKDKDIITLEDDEVSILLSSLEDQSIWTDAEMKYHKKTKYRDLALYTLLLSTGLRISEATNLDIGDIDFAHEQFRIRRKGGKQQTIGMNPAVISTLSDYIEYERPFLIKSSEEAALFCSIRKQRISARQIETMTRQINLKLFPLKHITPHKMRSTFGTKLQEEYGDIYLTASALGHSDIATTKKHYAKMDQEKVTEAVKNHVL